MKKENRWPSGLLTRVLLLLCLLVLVWSGIGPYDRATWWLEVAPVLIAVPVLIATHKRFPLTPLLYGLIFIHAVILMVGGHYTYAQVPAGFWVQDLFDLGRNHYDRLGHIAQGFVPVILAREILIRLRVVNGRCWLNVIVVSLCLAFSAFYEMLEWWTAVYAGEGATAFLGTQGDIWDTQWDMFLCMMGAITSLLLLSRVHDRQLAKIDPGLAKTPKP